MITSLNNGSSNGGKSATPGKGTILFIDDDKVILEMVGSRLKIEGYVVFTSTRAEEALDMLERITADLIILDISMPGLGGLGFLRSIAERFRPPPCPVIVFSARHELESFFDDGKTVSAFVAKTCDPEIFISRIHQLMTKHCPSPSPGPNSLPQKWKLLLIEDDKDLRYHLASFFNRNGFDVHKFEEGRSVLETAVTNKPNVILIKYYLSNHNGPGLAEQLATHASTQHIPVVLYDDTGVHSSEQHFQNVRFVVPSGQDTQLLQAVLKTVHASAVPA